MTQDPTHAGLSPDKVAELERKLAEAAAEVARVQAELQQALHAGDPPPPSARQRPPSRRTPPRAPVRTSATPSRARWPPRWPTRRGTCR